MATGGFVSGAAEQTAGAISSINFSFAGMPVISYGALTIFFLLSYKLDSTREQMQKELQQRRTAASN
jgi:Na+/melibiose symporter-like transporter